MLLYQGKYKKLFPFALMFEKFSLKKQKKHVKRNIRNFVGFASSLLKCKTFAKHEARKSHFLKYKKFCQNGVFFILQAQKVPS